jgi:hypothetical protein
MIRQVRHICFPYRASPGADEISVVRVLVAKEVRQ